MGKRDATLQDCLEHFSETEMVRGWNCPKCRNGQGLAYKTQTIHEVSDTVLIFLKRFPDMKKERGKKP